MVRRWQHWQQLHGKQDIEDIKTTSWWGGGQREEDVKRRRGGEGKRGEEGCVWEIESKEAVRWCLIVSCLLILDARYSHLTYFLTLFTSCFQR